MTYFSVNHSRPAVRLGALLASLTIAAPVAVLATHSLASAAPAGGPTCQGLRASIVGTPGDDFLRGTAGRDVIVGLAGNDTLVGLQGNDVLCGNTGMDILLGGPGNDRLYGGRDGKFTPFDADNSRVFGDYLEGGPGADRLNGGSDPRMGKGRSAHRDVISFANAKNGVRVDLRRGTARGEGKDTLAAGLLHILGSHAADTVKAGRASLMTSTGAGNDTIIGSRRADLLNPDGRSTTINGVRRDPHIGSGGADTVRGRGGNDDILSIRGRDRLFGGTGNDQVTSFSGQIEVASAGSGRDRISVQPRLGSRSLTVRFGPASDDRRDTLDFDVRESSPMNLTWSLTSGILRNGDTAYRVDGARTIFWGTSKVRTSLSVTGTPRADDFNAQDSGPVEFLAGGGRDLFFGSVRADVFDGGAGTDTYDYDASQIDDNNTCVSVERDEYGFCAP